MLTPNAEIMKSAREALKGKMGVPIAVCVIFVLIFAVLGAIQIPGWICDVVLSGPLLVGLYLVFLNVIRGKEIRTGQLFEGFKSFGNALAAYIVMAVFVILWSLLLIVPGIIAAFSYSMTMLIIADDPKIDGLTAIRKSKEMMNGHKWKLFCLEFRFVGWLLLCVITLGIGLLWVLPYWLASHAKFYEEINTAQAS